MSFEGGSSRSHYVEESFWRRRRTCRQTEYWMTEVNKGLQKLKLGLNRLSNKFHKLDLETKINIRRMHFTIQETPQEKWH